MAGVTVGASIVGTTLVASPALAFSGGYEAYQNINSGNVLGAWQGEAMADFTAVRGLNDQISSVWNGSDHAVCFYIDKDYGGANVVVQPNSYGQWTTAPFNDAFSSEHIC